MGSPAKSGKRTDKSVRATKGKRARCRLRVEGPKPRRPKAGKMPFDLAKKACQEFGDKELLGVVLNQAHVHSKYGYYYGYGQWNGKSKKQRPAG